MMAFIAVHTTQRCAAVVPRTFQHAHMNPAILTGNITALATTRTSPACQTTAALRSPQVAHLAWQSMKSTNTATGPHARDAGFRAGQGNLFRGSPRGRPHSGHTRAEAG